MDRLRAELGLDLIHDVASPVERNEAALMMSERTARAEEARLTYEYFHLTF